MDLSKEVLKPAYEGKVVTITDFRMKYKSGISYQAVQYAIDNDKIDFMKIGDRTRLIVLTEKTLSYQPNDSPNRQYRSTIPMAAKKK